MQKYEMLLICILLTGCNLPISDSDDQLNSQAGTIVAQTLQAQGTSNPVGGSPSTATLGITETPTPTITPTYSLPLLNVNETTNCRIGPGQNYQLITSFTPGASIEIVGRYPTNNYWVVKIPGGDETCWIWGEFSTATGSYWVVPSVTAPTSSAPSSASKPGSLTYTYFCTFNVVTSDIDVALTWIDKANDELGFRVYRDNVQIADLSANTSNFSEVYAANPTTLITYSVASYNAVGESERASISFSCQ